MLQEKHAQHSRRIQQASASTTSHCEDGGVVAKLQDTVDSSTPTVTLLIARLLNSKRAAGVPKLPNTA